MEDHQKIPNMGLLNYIFVLNDLAVAGSLIDVKLMKQLMRKIDRLMKIFMKWLISEIDRTHCLSGEKEEREGEIKWNYPEVNQVIKSGV